MTAPNLLKDRMQELLRRVSIDPAPRVPTNSHQAVGWQIEALERLRDEILEEARDADLDDKKLRHLLSQADGIDLAIEALVVVSAGFRLAAAGTGNFWARPPLESL